MGDPIPGGGGSQTHFLLRRKGWTSSLKVMLLQSQVVCWKDGDI